MVCHFLTYIYFNVILKCFSGRLSFPDLSGRSSGGGRALRYSCYSSKSTLGLGSAMGKWNCYTVTVTQGVSNPNDRLGVNGTVATVAVARVSDCKSDTTNHDRNSLRDGEC
jgi:hypothetical protein